MQNYTIDQLQQETGASLDDIWLHLMDNYNDPEKVTVVTEAEYEALLAALGKGNEMVLSAANSLEQQESQQKILDIANQCFERDLVAKFQTDFAALQALVEVRNKGLNQILDQGDLEMSRLLQHRQTQQIEGYQTAIEQVAALVPDLEGDISLASISPGDAALAEFRDFAAGIQAQVGKKLVKQS